MLYSTVQYSMSVSFPPSLRYRTVRRRKKDAQISACFFGTQHPHPQDQFVPFLQEAKLQHCIVPVHYIAPLPSIPCMYARSLASSNVPSFRCPSPVLTLSVPFGPDPRYMIVTVVLGPRTVYPGGRLPATAHSRWAHWGPFYCTCSCDQKWIRDVTGPYKSIFSSSQ